LGFEAGAAAVDALVVVEAGFVAGKAVRGGTVDVLAGTTGFLSMGLAGLVDAGAAVPRYGTVVVVAGGLGFAALGAAGRAEPFVGAGWLGLSFRCILTCVPSALRLSCGACAAPFAPPTGRGAGFGTAAGCCGGLEAVVLPAPGPTMDIMSRKA
jgi:hypothetical protein